MNFNPTLIDFATLWKATPERLPGRCCVHLPPKLPGWVPLLPAILLTGCWPTPEVEVEPALPKPPTERSGAVSPAPSLAPLATKQQVVQAVDVGRPDPFAAVLTPRLISPPASPRMPIAGGPRTPPPPLEPPKGLVFQGVLQASTGREALVAYTPAESNGGGARSGTLRVGDVGTGEGDSLLPLGWRVRDIDVTRGLLVLQKGDQSVNLAL